MTKMTLEILLTKDTRKDHTKNEDYYLELEQTLNDLLNTHHRWDFGTGDSATTEIPTRNVETLNTILYSLKDKLIQRWRFLTNPADIHTKWR